MLRITVRALTLRRVACFWRQLFCNQYGMLLIVNCVPKVTKVLFVFSFRSRRTRGVKSSGRAGKRNSISAGNLEVPRLNLVRALLFVSSSFCFLTSRLFEIICTGRREFLPKETALLTQMSLTAERGRQHHYVPITSERVELREVWPLKQSTGKILEDSILLSKKREAQPIRFLTYYSLL